MHCRGAPRRGSSARAWCAHWDPILRFLDCECRGAARVAGSRRNAPRTGNAPPNCPGAGAPGGAAWIDPPIVADQRPRYLTGVGAAAARMDKSGRPGTGRDPVPLVSMARVAPLSCRGGRRVAGRSCRPHRRGGPRRRDARGTVLTGPVSPSVVMRRPRSRPCRQHPRHRPPPSGCPASPTDRTRAAPKPGAQAPRAGTGSRETSAGRDPIRRRSGPVRPRHRGTCPCTAAAHCEAVGKASVPGRLRSRRPPWVFRKAPGDPPQGGRGRAGPGRCPGPMQPGNHVMS